MESSLSLEEFKQRVNTSCAGREERLWVFAAGWGRVWGRQMLEEEACILKAGPSWGPLTSHQKSPAPAASASYCFPFLAASNEVSRILAPNPRFLPQHFGRVKRGQLKSVLYFLPCLFN